MIFITVTEDDVKEAAANDQFPIWNALKRKFGDVQFGWAWSYCEVLVDINKPTKSFTYSNNLKETLDCYRGSYESRIQFPAGRYGLFEN